MWVFVVCFRTCCSVCGVWTFGVRVVWLCIQMIDVSDGSVYW